MFVRAWNECFLMIYSWAYSQCIAQIYKKAGEKKGNLLYTVTGFPHT